MPKKLINPLDNVNNLKNKSFDIFVHKEGQVINNASVMPNTLANMTTGMDVYLLDIDKLIEAPKEWNFYSKLTDMKMFELMNSIYANGLLNPIIVWEQTNGEYMILSGHNRVDAYKKLYELYSKVNSEQATRFKKIHTMIFKKDSLDEEDAKQIIIDTNWVQRMLSPIEKQKSIFHKYASMGRKQRAKNGESDGLRIRDIIGKEFNISGRQISKYIKLNNLIDPYKELINGRKMNINAGVNLAEFNLEIQEWIYNNFKNILENKKIMKIKPVMSKEEIAYVFTNDDDIYKTFIKTRNLYIPATLKDKFLEHIFIFYKENDLLKDPINDFDFEKQILMIK